MARPKSPGIKLQSLAECNEALAELRQAISDIQILTAERDLAVAAASAKLEPSMNRAKEKKAATEAALEAYYYAHLAEVEKDGAKFVQLANGRIGRRDTPAALKALNRKWTREAIENAVRTWAGEKWRQFFHVPDPVIDKDALKSAKLTAEEYKQLGLKLEGDERFYAEPATLPAPAEVR